MSRLLLLAPAPGRRRPCRCRPRRTPEPARPPARSSQRGVPYARQRGGDALGRRGGAAARPRSGVGARGTGPCPIPADGRPPDAAGAARARPKNWRVYRSRFIDPVRIAAGVKFWQENRGRAGTRASSSTACRPKSSSASSAWKPSTASRWATFRVIDCAGHARLQLSRDAPARRRAQRVFPRRAGTVPGDARRNATATRCSRWAATRARWACRSSCPAAAARWAVDFDGDGRIDLVAQCRRRDRLGGQLLQELRLAARHADVLPGAASTPPGWTRTPCSRRTSCRPSVSSSFMAKGAVLEGAALAAPRAARAGRTAERRRRAAVRRRHRELLRHHPLQLVELLRDGGDRAGQRGEECRAGAGRATRARAPYCRRPADSPRHPRRAPQPPQNPRRRTSVAEPAAAAPMSEPADAKQRSRHRSACRMPAKRHWHPK